MPTTACLFFHQCTGCGNLSRPKDGDCCVFCSYGSVPCPPVQEGGRDCCEPEPNVYNTCTLARRTVAALHCLT